MASPRTDISGARFLVEVDGRDIGWFHEVSGLQVEMEMDSYQEGGVNGFVHHLPGRMTWPNLVLRRGVTVDDNLLAWFHRASGTTFVNEGKIAPTTAAVVLLDQQLDRIRSWNLEAAVPVRWSGPTLASASATLPVEELEVAHHGFRVENH